MYYTNTSGIVTQLNPSQYTLYINPPATGSLWGVGGTLTYPLTGSPIASGTTLTISRSIPYQQLVSISNQGDFSPQVIEEALDTLCMEIQQLQARTGLYRGTWQTGIAYNYGDVVQDGINGAGTGNLYMCLFANTSGTWATDLAAGDWQLVLSIETLTPGSLPISGGTITGSLNINGTLTVDTYSFPLQNVQAYYGTAVATSNTTLAPVNTIQSNLQAGGTYSIYINGYVSTSTSAGYKTGIFGSCTATLFRADGTNDVGGTLTSGYQTGSLGQVVAGAFNGISNFVMNAILVVNAAGTIGLEFAQYNSDTNSSTLIAATMIVTRIS